MAKTTVGNSPMTATRTVGRQRRGGFGGPKPTAGTSPMTRRAGRASAATKRS